MISPTVAWARTALPIASMRLPCRIAGILAYSPSATSTASAERGLAHLEEALELGFPFHLWADARVVGGSSSVAFLVGIHADDDALARAHLALDYRPSRRSRPGRNPRRSRDIPFEDRAVTKLVEVGKDLLRLALKLVGELFYEP